MREFILSIEKQIPPDSLYDLKSAARMPSYSENQSSRTVWGGVKENLTVTSITFNHVTLQQKSMPSYKESVFSLQRANHANTNTRQTPNPHIHNKKSPPSVFP